MFKTKWILMFFVTFGNCVPNTRKNKLFKSQPPPDERTAPYELRDQHPEVEAGLYQGDILLHEEDYDRVPKSELELLRNQPVEVQAGLYQGDILMDEDTYKFFFLNRRLGYNRKNYPRKFWPKGVAPYTINRSYSEKQKQVIENAITSINQMTCIKLIPWNGRDSHYINITFTESGRGCYSLIGRAPKGGKGQILALNRRCLYDSGTSVHEILHALGTFHEHVRWDRDKYVEFHPENVIRASFLKEFEKLERKRGITKHPYDYRSIMHYGTDYFAIRNKRTLTPKKKGAKIGQRQGLTELDCLKLNDLYECMNNKKNQLKYKKVCKSRGVK